MNTFFEKESETFWNFWVSGGLWYLSLCLIGFRLIVFSDEDDFDRDLVLEKVTISLFIYENNDHDRNSQFRWLILTIINTLIFYPQCQHGIRNPKFFTYPKWSERQL